LLTFFLTFSLSFFFPKNKKQERLTPQEAMAHPYFDPVHQREKNGH